MVFPPPGSPLYHQRGREPLSYSVVLLHNLRYAGDTTQMAESEEEPKSLLVKEGKRRK